MITKDQLKSWLAQPKPTEDLQASIRKSPSTPMLLNALRKAFPDVTSIPQTTYTLYREFEHLGVRYNYEAVYFEKRARLTRAVLEMLAGDDSYRDAVHDLLWNICEETSWILPAHEERRPRGDGRERRETRTWPLGAHTPLTHAPDSIDLFSAETGAALAEAICFLGDRLAPEVRQRVRQEVQRHIFKPYLAYGRQFRWHKAPMNWNGVCNGAVGLAFLRLENDVESLAEALEMVLEGFETYIATGFEADGGSIEGVGYWNYGLMYYIVVAELLREVTGGQLDLLATPRLRDIAAYPVGMAFTPNTYINFGDATETQILAGGVVERLADRTGVSDLKALLETAGQLDIHAGPGAKLPIMLRQAAWWPASPPPGLPHRDFYLLSTNLLKFTARTPTGQPVILAAKAGYTDGPHVQCDIAQFIVNVDGESLIPDAGRGLYSRDYFREKRFENLFNSSRGHNVPRIGEKLQSPGPEFGGSRRFYGTIVEHDANDSEKVVKIDFHTAYDLPALKHARRTLYLKAQTGEVWLEDDFTFNGSPQEIEEAFVTWHPIKIEGATARITGTRSALELKITAPEGATFTTTSLEEDCKANRMGGVLTRLSATLPEGTTHFALQIVPVPISQAAV
jgi:hypothetical protein